MRRQERTLPAQLAITTPRATLAGRAVSPRTPRVGIPPRNPRIGVSPRKPRIVGTSEEVINRAIVIVGRWIPAAANRTALFAPPRSTQSAIWASGPAAGAIVNGPRPPDVGQMVLRASLPGFRSLCRYSVPVVVVGGAEVFCSRCRFALADTRDATPSGCLLASITLGAKYDRYAESEDHNVNSKP